MKSSISREALSEEQINAIVEEARELTERWDEEVEGTPDDREPAKKAITADPEMQALSALIGTSVTASWISRTPRCRARTLRPV